MCECIGPDGAFNVRNEVDKHATTVGAHNDNTHFLTGDGGFINAVVAGYAGLEQGRDLRLHPPVLPEGDIAGLRLRNLQFRGASFTYYVSATGSMELTASAKSSGVLCLYDGGLHGPWRLTTTTLVFKTADFGFPGHLKLCSNET